MLKLYEEFTGFHDRISYLEEILKNHKCEKIDGKWSNISSSVDLILNEKFVKNGKLLVQFGKTGSFDCSDIGLTTLEGCPNEVDGGFSCSFNDITNLIGGPIHVNGYYYCSHNTFLTSLEGCAKVVSGYFLAHSNRKLKTLYGMPYTFNYDKDSFEQTGVPEIEKEFAKRKAINDLLKYNNYYKDLLKYIKEVNILEIGKIHWPKWFIESQEENFKNLIKTSKGIKKFNL